MVDLALGPPPGETTHWTGRMMARPPASACARCSASGGARTRAAPNPQFKLSNDPKFVDKLRDVVGLYVDPPAHAIVLSVDEKRSHGEWIATDAPAE